MKVPKPTPKAKDYLKPQGRFSHLFKTESGKAQLKFIEEMAKVNIKQYGLK
jgi:hypothetical protein